MEVSGQGSSPGHLTPEEKPTYTHSLATVPTEISQFLF
jgi:hypothetical protein